MSFFENVELLPNDPILGLPSLFAADPHEKKVNLGIGTYKDENGKPLVLSAVRKAEKILSGKDLNKEYQPIEGNPNFLKSTNQLIYGKEFPLDPIGAVQTIGGTGALRIAAEFFVKHGHQEIYLSDPTWPNHLLIFQKGNMHLKEYPYCDYAKSSLIFPAMCESLEKMAAGSVVLLHASCHNPTGIDLSHDQWKQVSDIVKKHRLIPFFDLAYQGLGVSLEEDAWPIRYFASQNHEMFVASSYSKNLGLYGERVGSLSWLMPTKEISDRLMSQFKQIVRGLYSTPPLHGGRLVEIILSTPELKEEWSRELEQMRQRIVKMRVELAERLNAKKLKKDFTFITRQNGMFSLCGLNPDEVEKLKNEYGIYMLSNGRMSMAGLTHSNIDYVADSIAAV
jgi:aspartate/tyrosine/aromatic aminotransferase